MKTAQLEHPTEPLSVTADRATIRAIVQDEFGLAPEDVLRLEEIGQKLGTFVSSENAADLVVLRELIEAGKIAPAIDRAYPLSEAAAAIRYMLDGHARGKVVLTVTA